MFRFALLFLLLAVLGTANNIEAEEDAKETGWSDRLSLKGWLDTVQSVRTDSPNDMITSRVRLRLEGAADLGRVYGFLSLQAEKNWQIDSETGVNPHELWFEYTGAGWDLRLGRQIIIWGRADGVQITDVISPPDYTEFITRDLDEIRMPVYAAKLRRPGDLVDIELIWIPVFKAAVQPSGDNPWAVRQEWPENIRVSSEEANEPSTSLANSEIALKFSAYLSGLDVAASVFHTWDDFPAMHRSVSISDAGTIDILYQPKHHRLTIFGLEFARPWGDFVFRGEAAWYKGRYLGVNDPAIDPMAKDLVKWLFGVDWSVGNDWNVIAQLAGDTIFNYDECLSAKEHSTLATLNISKELFNQTLQISNMLYFSINDGEFFNRIKAQYELQDGMHITLGWDYFQGDDGQYGVYENNSQVWLKLKYSF